MVFNIAFIKLLFIIAATIVKENVSNVTLTESVYLVHNEVNCDRSEAVKN